MRLSASNRDGSAAGRQVKVMSAAIAKNLMAEMKLLGMFAAYDQLRRPRATSRNDLSAALLLISARPSVQ